MPEQPWTFDAPGWSVASRDERDGHLRIEYAAGSCRIVFERWPGLPPTPGGVMQVASRRQVMVDGVTKEVVTTSMFAGRADEVQVLFDRDGPAHIRIVFRHCTREQADAVLAGATLRRWSRSFR